MSINTLKTAALLGFLTALLLIGGQAIAGRQGLYIVLAVTALMNFVSYFYSDKIALMSYSAQPVSGMSHSFGMGRPMRWHRLRTIGPTRRYASGFSVSDTGCAE